MRQLQDFRNEFTPELYDIIKSKDELEQPLVFLVMEYFESDLAELISLGSKSGITEMHIVMILYNILCALKFLHSANILHRDIKPSNILVNKLCQVKICDFGISRTLPESCVGKGSGNSKRIRDSILKQNLSKRMSEQEIRAIIEKTAKKNNSASTILKEVRCLSSHVGSRWYRAPEISILAKRYDQASDMWGIGCCLYEMLTLTTNFNSKSRVLFRGDSCRPLSPYKGQNDCEKSSLSKNDQIVITLNNLAKLTPSDLMFTKKKDAVDYLLSLSSDNMTQIYTQKIQGANEQLIDLLKSLIQLNPYFRKSAGECLKNQVFDEIRQPQNECSAPSKIKILVDKDEAFNYATGKSELYTHDDFMKMLDDEIEYYKKTG